MGVYIPYTRLPSAYQEVEWIGRNGNNYIDTGWIPKQATTPFEVRVGYKISTVGVRYGILSNYNGTSSMGSVALEINSGTDTSNKARFFIQSYGIDVLSSNSINTSSFNDIIFKKNTGGSLEVSVNGINKTASTITEASNYMYSAYLFIDRGLRWSEFSSNSFISYCKIYEGSNLVRDFVPCYRKSDNVIGLYDLVNSAFYTNSGSGTFSKGADVVMTELKNAYIGEVVDISSDLRGATLAGLQAQGWDGINAANSGYTLNANGLTPGTTNSNNNVLLYKYIPELNSNSIITLHMTGYATRNWSTNSYQYNTVAIMGLFNSSDATDSGLYTNALQCNYSACGSTQSTKTGINYRSSGALTILGTAGTGNQAGNVDMTAKINLGTGLVEYTLTSPQTHSTSATLNSTQLSLVRSLKYIGFVMSPKDKSNTPTLYTVELTVE